MTHADYQLIKTNAMMEAASYGLKWDTMKSHHKDFFIKRERNMLEKNRKYKYL